MNFKKLIIIFFVILGLVLFPNLFQSDYVLIKPGSAENLRQLVSVEGADQDDAGTFYLITVAQERVGLLATLYGYIHPHIEVRRLAEVIPQGMEHHEYRELLQQWMKESQLTAQLIALRRAGFQVDIISEGTLIVGFLENSPAEGILQAGDIIVAVDGAPVGLANEVISAVQLRGVGDPVQLTIMREDLEMNLDVITEAHPDNPSLPALGIYIQTLYWEPVLPLEIQIEAKEIGGPSAGVMFVLEILNQLDPEDITGGRQIAGTGTIDVQENIGMIGGVLQKVVAAENAGAEYFIVPEGNYREAKKAARRIELVPVSTLQDVINFLETIDATETGMHMPCDKRNGFLIAGNSIRCINIQILTGYNSSCGAIYK